VVAEAEEEKEREEGEVGKVVVEMKMITRQLVHLNVGRLVEVDLFLRGKEVSLVKAGVARVARVVRVIVTGEGVMRDEKGILV